MLTQDPKAQKELAGLKNFVQDVRSAALQEEVPLTRLMAMLPDPAPKRSWLPKIVWSTGLAAAAILAIWLVVPKSQAPSLLVSEIYTNDPVVATNWAAQKLQTFVPTMDMGDDAELFFVHEGGDRCCFDYKVNGKTYHVNIRAGGGKPGPGTPTKLENGQTVMVGQGVRWNQNGYDLHIVGPDDAVNVKLANRTSELLNSRT